MKTICPYCDQEYPDTPDEYLGMSSECLTCHRDFIVEKVRFCQECGTANAAQAVQCRQCGKSFARGNGVAKNEAEAVKWYRKAAEQGHAKAREILNILEK